MIDFDFQRFTKKSHATGHDLQPGEVYFSVLQQEDGDVVRHDFHGDAWTGPPENAICWWKATMEDPQSTKAQWAPSDQMLHEFESLLADPTRQDAAYVMALLLVRRKIVRLDDIEKADDGTERMVLTSLKREGTYNIAVIEPEPDRIDAIQAHLTKLLDTGN